MSERYDERDADWPLRPWIMAAICAVAGLLFETARRHRSDDTRLGGAPGGRGLRRRRRHLVRHDGRAAALDVGARLRARLGRGHRARRLVHRAATTSTAKSRIPLPVGAVRGAARRALVPDRARRGRVALPLCAAPRPRLDRRGDRRGVAGVRRGHLPPRLADRGLFDVIGIDAIKDLLKESWFGWMLAGFAFGAAVGMLRERDALMATLQRLVMVVLGVLAPVLAAALLLFLLSLPFTGLGELWDSSIPATPMMLLAGAGAILLANAVIGNGTDDRATSRVLRALGAGARPDRPAAGDHRRAVARPAHRPIWLDPRAHLGRRRGRRRDRLRARRLVDGRQGPRTISTTSSARSRPSSRSACAASPCSSRCRSSTSAPSRPRRRWRATPRARSTRGQFDWQAMAFDFGPAGRKRLAELARSGTPGPAQARQRRARDEEPLPRRRGSREAGKCSATLGTLAARSSRKERPSRQRCAMPIAGTRFCRVGHPAR